MEPVETTTRCVHHGCKAAADVFIEISGISSHNAWYSRTCLLHFFDELQKSVRLPVSGVRTVRVARKCDKEFRCLFGGN